MRDKLKRVLNTFLYFLVDAGASILILYVVSMWLARYSLVFAYLGNLALIIVALLLDEFTFKWLNTNKLVTQLKESDEKGRPDDYRAIQWIMDNFISFKTTLYLIYIFILLFSQIIELNSGFLSESLSNFFLINRYNIVLLIAVDKLIGQFSSDRKRMDATSESLARHMNECEE
jgi:hypothetical protein